MDSPFCVSKFLGIIAEAVTLTSDSSGCVGNYFTDLDSLVCIGDLLSSLIFTELNRT